MIWTHAELTYACVFFEASHCGCYIQINVLIDWLIVWFKCDNTDYHGMIDQLDLCLTVGKYVLNNLVFFAPVVT